MKRPKLQRVSLHLSSRQIELLEAEAKRTGIPRAEQVRGCVDRYFKRRSQELNFSTPGGQN